MDGDMNEKPAGREGRDGGVKRCRPGEGKEIDASKPAPDDSATPHLRVHEWGLNPIFWSYVKLFARDVHGLGTLEGIDDSHVLHGNKAIQRVEVSGIVVHVKPGATKTFGSYVKYILDDGTGLLPCTQYEQSAGRGAVRRGHAERHELGDLLVVRGRLKRYRGAREVVITSASKPVDANEEMLHWLRCVELGRTVYPLQFKRDEYVDEDIVQHCSQAQPTKCECGAAYAEAVGYCRCVAAPVALDPHFEFRDALLAHLAAKEECLLNVKEHLRFQFARDVRDEPSLREVAVRVVSSAAAVAPALGRSDGGRPSDGDRSRGGGAHARPQQPTNGEEASASAGAAVASGVWSAGATGMQVKQARVMELLRAVMSSLHRDGALHFLDKTEDIYVLVSRRRVLQPAVEEACRQRRLGFTQENEIIRTLQGSALFHHVPGVRIRACVRRMKIELAQGQRRHDETREGTHR